MSCCSKQYSQVYEAAEVESEVRSSSMQSSAARFLPARAFRFLGAGFRAARALQRPGKCGTPSLLVTLS